MAISLSSGAIGQSGNIAALASITTTVSCKIQFRVDVLRQFVASSDSAGLWQICDATGGTHPKLLVFFGNDSTKNNIYFTLNVPGVGGVGGLAQQVLLSTLPANGTDMVVYAGFDSTGPTQFVGLYDTTGTLYYSASGTSNLGTLTTGAGANGAVLLNDTNPSNNSFPNFIGGAAFYNVLLTGANRYSAPASGDTGIVAMWKFNDATSGTTPTSGAATVGSQAEVWSGTYVWANDAAAGSWFGAVTTTVNVTGIPTTTTIGSLTFSGTTVTFTPTGINTTSSIGTISTTGASNPLVTGGRVLFTPGSGSADFDTSSAAIQALTKIGVKMKFDAGALAGIAANGTMALWMIDDNAAGTGTNCKIRCFAVCDASSNLTIRMQLPNVGGIDSATFTASQLPAAGNDVILYTGWDNSVFTQQIALYDSLGNSIVSTTGNLNLGALPVITGNGFLHVNLANNPTVNPTSPSIAAMNIDGFALYGGLLSGTAQWSTPSDVDAGLVAFFRFDEQTGGITADDLNGPHLNLFNFAWGSGGTWLASNQTKITITGIVSTSTIGAIAAGSNAAVVSPHGIPSTTTVTAIQEDDATSYVVGISTTTTLGSVSVSTFVGPIITGIPSTTTIGNVTVTIQNTITTPLPGGPPIQGTVGIAPLPPATLSFIVQQAILFSTANIQTPSFTLDPVVACQRINSDQNAIFAKLADRNRNMFLRIAPVTTTNASSARAISLTQLPAPLMRPLQLVLQDGRTANLVDLLDPSAELAPRYYVFNTNLVEVGSDFSTVAGPVNGMLWYVQAPAPINLNGDLTQRVTIPGDWSDLLIIPLASYIAASDLGRPGDEIARLQKMYDSRLESWFLHLSQYAGVAAQRFDIPRPMGTAR